jgi:hypothetical protein
MLIVTPQTFDDLLRMQSYPPTTCLLRRRKIRKVNRLQKQLISLAVKLNLDGEVEFTPPECLSLKGVYTPRLDAAWMIKVPEVASDLMSTIFEKYSFKAARDLCHLTLFGFEYEKATGHKHVAGGVANLSRHSYLGFLLTPSEKVASAKRIVNKYSLAFGFNNVFVLDEDSIQRGWQL